MNSKKEVQHIYLIGAKSLGAYGGYETFVYKLTEYHQHKENIKYHVACKANDKRQIIEAVRKISQTEAYKTYLSSLNFIEKLKEVVRYRGYILYPLWVKIWKK